MSPSTQAADTLPAVSTAASPALNQGAPVQIYYAVVPKRNVGKLAVPAQYVEDTEGSRKYRKAVQAFPNRPLADGCKEFSLCLQHQDGKCYVGSGCNQLHVDPEFLKSMDFWESSKHTCCFNHKDFNSIGQPLFKKATPVQFHVVSETGSLLGNPITLDKFAWTAGLKSEIQSADNRLINVNGITAIPISMRNICRLHSTDECRYGRDCSRVHLCRLVAAELQLPQVPRKKARSPHGALPSDRSAISSSLPAVTTLPSVGSTAEMSLQQLKNDTASIPNITTIPKPPTPQETPSQIITADVPKSVPQTTPPTAPVTAKTNPELATTKSSLVYKAPTHALPRRHRTKSPPTGPNGAAITEAPLTLQTPVPPPVGLKSASPKRKHPLPAPQKGLKGTLSPLPNTSSNIIPASATPILKAAAAVAQARNDRAALASVASALQQKNSLLTSNVSLPVPADVTPDTPTTDKIYRTYEAIMNCLESSETDEWNAANGSPLGISSPRIRA